MENVQQQSAMAGGIHKAEAAAPQKTGQSMASSCIVAPNRHCDGRKRCWHAEEFARIIALFGIAFFMILFLMELLDLRGVDNVSTAMAKTMMSPTTTIGNNITISTSTPARDLLYAAHFFIAAGTCVCIIVAQWQREPSLYMPYLIYNAFCALYIFFIFCAMIFVGIINTVFTPPPFNFTSNIPVDAVFVIFFLITVGISVFCYFAIFRAWQWQKSEREQKNVVGNASGGNLMNPITPLTRAVLDTDPKYRCCFGHIEEDAFIVICISFVLHLTCGLTFGIIFIHWALLLFLALFFGSQIVAVHCAAIFAQRKRRPTLYVPFLIYMRLTLSLLIIFFILALDIACWFLLHTFPIQHDVSKSTSGRKIAGIALACVIVFGTLICIFAWFYTVVERARQYMNAVQTLDANNACNTTQMNSMPSNGAAASCVNKCNHVQEAPAMPMPNLQNPRKPVAAV